MIDNISRFKQSGRSMIEMLGVLAIIGVLSVGGIAGYTKAMMKSKVNSTVETMLTIAANVRTLTLRTKNYDNLAKVAIKMKAIPDKALNGSTLGSNAFGGSVGLGKFYNKSFYIAMNGLPKEACVEIASKDLLQNEYTMRLYDATARNFGPLLVAIGELTRALGSFTGIVREIMEGIDEDDKDAPCYYESKVILRHLESYVILLKNFSVWDEKRDDVFWIQKKRLPPDMVQNAGDAEYVILTQTPLDISHLMNEGVFEPMESVICTSATLKTGRDFSYWMRRTGVSLAGEERIIKGEFPSPFPYNKNMLFAVPNDAPLPDNIQFQQYVEMALPRLIQAAAGRTLVLFTSYESLKSAYRTTVASMPGFPGRVMKQGDDDNAKLLEAFKKENESVLFATDSFWQGVDIPGESLSQVIIVKLPFTVPNDPVFVARAEAIEKRGGSSFMELSVPEAVIKFRQGIGRLIRRSDDKGVVVVLDRRIYEKKYGSIFIASMPDCKKAYEPVSELSRRINSFIFG